MVIYVQAFTAFDFYGNNYVTAQNIVDSKMAYRLPFTKVELRHFLENTTIFKRMPRLSIDMFIKYLFPENLRGAQNQEERGASESSDSGNESIDTSTGGSAVKRNSKFGDRKNSREVASSYGGSTLLSGSLKS